MLDSVNSFILNSNWELKSHFLGNLIVQKVVNLQTKTLFSKSEPERFQNKTNLPAISKQLFTLRETRTIRAGDKTA